MHIAFLSMSFLFRQLLLIALIDLYGIMAQVSGVPEHGDK